MEIRLKNLHDAACRNIRSIGKYKPFDKFHDRNNIIMETLFNQLIDGNIDFIALKDDTYFKCIHRSTRGYKAQFSIGYYDNGKLIPQSHTNLNTFEDLRSEGFPSGIWEYGKAA